jgi:hypothetical protein
LAAGEVERRHQVPREPLPQWVLLREGAQLCDELGGAAAREIRRESIFDGGEARFLEPETLRGQQEPLRLRKRLAGPEVERIAEQVRGSLRIAVRQRRAAALDKAYEAVQVELVFGQFESVPRRLCLKALRAESVRLLSEDLPELRDIPLKRVDRARGRVAGPEFVDEDVCGDDGVRAE